MRTLDTDILIDIQRSFNPAILWLDQLDVTPSIAGFVAMEILQNARNKAELTASRKLIRMFNVIWPSALDCQKAYEDFAAYHLSHNLGLLDSLIGATAVGQSATLCTFNRKHFAVIPNLVIEMPYTK